MNSELIHQSHHRRLSADAAQVATTLGLVLSLAVAITTVSIGIARADTLSAVASHQGGHIYLATFFAFVLAGMSGLTAAVVRDVRNPKRCDQ